MASPCYGCRNGRDRLEESLRTASGFRLRYPSGMDTATNTPIPATASTDAKIRASATAIQSVAAVVSSPNKESALVALKQALPNIGGALMAFGVLSPDVWTKACSIIGLVLSAAVWAWHNWDDRRAAHAVQAAATDAGLAEKKEANRSAVYAPLLALVFLPTALFAGCAHYSIVPLDNTPALRARAEFDAARRAAPDWTLAALNTIADLEHEVALAAPFGVKVVTPEQAAKE